MMTGKDGKTTDAFRVWGAIGFASIMALSGYAIYRRADFGPVEYAAALGGYLTAWAAAIWAKRDTEPTPAEPEPMAADLEIDQPNYCPYQPPR